MTITRNFFSTLAILLFTLNPAMPNVTLTLGDVEVDGYTSDIVVPVTLVNPADAVGGFQFDIVATPHLLDISFVDPVDDDNLALISIPLMMVRPALFFIIIREEKSPQDLWFQLPCLTCTMMDQTFYPQLST